MKRLQNEISQISTNLIQNLKIKIISIMVLNRYFFENFHFHIESNCIDIELKSNQISSVFCIDFSILPILAYWKWAATGLFDSIKQRYKTDSIEICFNYPQKGKIKLTMPGLCCLLLCTLLYNMNFSLWTTDIYAHTL
jgi:hypothetical protein